MNDTVSALDAIFEPFKRSDAPGLVVGIAHHGRPIYRRGFGLASIEHGVANSVRTRMRIGSTSKHFASLAALLLAEEGKLDLDASVRVHLPEMPPSAQAFTLRQFMNHTSGMRDSLDLGLVSSGLAVRPVGAGLASQIRQGEANFAPGHKMIYNNGGYQLLSLVIQRVSGLSFEQFLQQRLFEPLGMHDTISVPSDFDIHPGVATLHVPQPGGGWRRGMFPTEEVRGEGGIVSTVDDMLRWLAHLRGPRTVGSADSWTQMLTPARLANGRECLYSLGLILEPYRGLDVIQHGGTVIGGHCQMLTVLEHELDVIVIGNGVTASLSELGFKVVEAVLGEAAFPQPAEPRARVADHAQLVGARYATPEGDLVLAFGDANGDLALSLYDSPPLPLVAEGGALHLPFSRSVTGPYRLDLAPGADAPQTLEVDDAGGVLTLQRLPDAGQSLAEAATALVGRYRVPDADANARIEVDGDDVVIRWTSDFGPYTLRLTAALSPDLFAWHHTGSLAAVGGVLKVERQDGRVSGLRLHTLRTRHLHLLRLDDAASA